MTLNLLSKKCSDLKGPLVSEQDGPFWRIPWEEGPAQLQWEGLYPKILPLHTQGVPHNGVPAPPHRRRLPCTQSKSSRRTTPPGSLKFSGRNVCCTQGQFADSGAHFGARECLSPYLGVNPAGTPSPPVPSHPPDKPLRWPNLARSGAAHPLPWSARATVSTQLPASTAHALRWLTAVP